MPFKALRGLYRILYYLVKPYKALLGSVAVAFAVAVAVVFAVAVAVAVADRNAAISTTNGSLLLTLWKKHCYQRFSVIVANVV